MKKLRVALVAALLAVVLSVAWAAWVARRALPPREGAFHVAGIHGRAEIIRDRWGVPHVFAASDEDAYFALGWATAQDRLFQMELNRRLATGRLAEIFGVRALKADRLFRTMDFAGPARRMLASARPEAVRAAEAYARGINAWVAELKGQLPPEFALLRIGFEPARAEDFTGILGFMAWNLNLSWDFDPLFERLVDKVGEERALELFPYDFGGSPSVYPSEPLGLKLSLLDGSSDLRDLVSFGPGLSGSNNWVVGPAKSATGGPILCNDPHLAHALPGIWYEAHLKTPNLDVAGVTIPGFPLVVIGHNRDIAWGMTNLMLDGGDFFIEKLDPRDPTRVMSRGDWVPVLAHPEVIKVRGEPDVTMTVRKTPHGPIVSDLMPGETRALAFQWNYQAAAGGGEIDALYALDRARNWAEFRAAARLFGAVAQNVAYADRGGHIGLQAVGAIPRFRGRQDGLRFREGWDGSEDWNGFVPFDEHPFSFDPPRGWLASANNPTVPAPATYYISSQWEPVDRYARIQELLESKSKLSIEDMERMQGDTVVVSARELVPLILSASEARPSSDADDAGGRRPAPRLGRRHEGGQPGRRALRCLLSASVLRDLRRAGRRPGPCLPGEEQHIGHHDPGGSRGRSRPLVRPRGHVRPWRGATTSFGRPWSTPSPTSANALEATREPGAGTASTPSSSSIHWAAHRTCSPSTSTEVPTRFPGRISR